MEVVTTSIDFIEVNLTNECSIVSQLGLTCNSRPLKKAIPIPKSKHIRSELHKRSKENNSLPEKARREVLRYCLLTEMVLCTEV